MKPASFIYHRPTSVREITRLLSEHAGEDIRILAGGQSLAPMMAFRLACPAHLVDINAAADLGHLGVAQGQLRIGALVRHKDLARVPEAGVTGALLGHVMPFIAHLPIRTRGTFCGSVAHADPASEWCLVTMALGGNIVLSCAEGMRSVAAPDFFAGAMSTAARATELIREVQLPLLPPDTRFGFQEFSRRRGDFALSMVLVTFRLDDGLVRAPCIAVGGAEDRPRRMSGAEALLEGRAPSASTFAAAAAAVGEALQPMEDPSTTAAYRRDLTVALTVRALEEAMV